MVLAQAIDAVGNPTTPGEEPNVLYMYLLEACDKVFENELDQATFEEHMRWFFGSKVMHPILVRSGTLRKLFDTDRNFWLPGLPGLHIG